VKKISIITATYNAETVLENMIQSIILQKTNEIEFIIIDGNSKDNTKKIIKNYNTYIDYFVSEPDKGIYDAWNKGIVAAKGEWLMFIGADDELLPDAINKYLDLLNSKDLSSYDYISAQNEFINDKNKILKIIGNGAKWKLMRRGNSAAHVASLHHKKNLFGSIGYYNLNYKICADYELLLRKKNSLKSYFFKTKIAKMKVGGMSFTTNAIKEIYEIRKLHKTISPLFNKLLYFRDYFAFKLFKLRKSV
jgi:glycosyltransferase involved in cell wall biosynthesis